ncbi:hypothetical protein EDB85DRAFT_2146448 [Lactarius pseudohatsudake]|nr:hypothetical protein EDB85DRAFT_2146448 [Lactarius pseudohatsudake]
MEQTPFNSQPEPSGAMASNSPPITHPSTDTVAAPGLTTADDYGRPAPGDEQHQSYAVPSFDYYLPPNQLAAGRSPQDSRMGSPLPPSSPQDSQMGSPTGFEPESEEPTFPFNGDEVNHLLTTLPPQPENIEVRGRPAGAFPRASRWSEVQEASVSPSRSDHVLPQLSDQELSEEHVTEAVRTFQRTVIRPPLLLDNKSAAGIRGRLQDGDFERLRRDALELVAEETARELTDTAVGYGGYTLKIPLPLRREHDLPVDSNDFHKCVSVVILALDGGAARHEGELAFAGLPPQSWTRLSMAVLSAIIRGTLRSPAYLRNGSAALNYTPDAYPMGPIIDRPLTEGGALMIMAQQIAVLFNNHKNHPDKDRPDYAKRLDDLVFFLAKRADQIGRRSRYSDLVNLITDPVLEEDAPLARDQAKTRVKDKLLKEAESEMRNDPARMKVLAEEVKASISRDLNIEALENLDEWREVYRHEFGKAMVAEVHRLNPGLAPSNPPAAVPTLSQVLRDAEPAIKADVRVRATRELKRIHDSVVDGLTNDESTWVGPAYREKVKKDAIAKHQRDAEDEINAFKASLSAQINEERAAFRLREKAALDSWMADDLEAIAIIKRSRQDDASRQLNDITDQLNRDGRDSIRLHKETLHDNLKTWKRQYNTARELGVLRGMANRLGFSLTPIDPANPTVTIPTVEELKVGGTVLVESFAPDVDSCPPSPTFRSSSLEYETPQPTTPDRAVAPRVDPNVTPTPIRTKRRKDADVSSPLPAPPLFVLASSSSPMEECTTEDRITALDDRADMLSITNPGSEASVHAHLRDTGASISTESTTIPPPRDPDAAPHAVPLVSATRVPTTDPLPAPLPYTPSNVVEPVRPPPGGDADANRTLLRMLQSVISRLEGMELKFEKRLDQQDQTISDILVPRGPTSFKGGKTAKGKEAGSAPPIPGTASTVTANSMDEALAHAARVDDPAEAHPIEEVSTEGATQRVRLVPNVDGKPKPSATMPASWANIVNQGTAAANHNAATVNKNVLTHLGRSGQGKSRPEAVARKSKADVTEVTVLREGGLEDPGMEAALYGTSPASIVSDVRQNLEKVAPAGLRLMSGRWGTNNTPAHNFIFSFQGKVSFADIFPYRERLLTPLHCGYIVPNDGWTYAYCRQVKTTNNQGVVHSPEALKAELLRNKAFEDAIFCITPHWQGNVHSLANKAESSVKLAYVDESGALTERIITNGVFMFGRQIRFVVTGDTPHAPLAPQASAALAAAAATIPTSTRPSAPTSTTRGLRPPPLATKPTPLTPPTRAQPASATSAKELTRVATQPDEAPFTLVGGKTSRKSRAKSRTKAAMMAQNATVPGSSERVTAPIPARLAGKPGKGKRPTPPTLDEAAVINATHLADAAATTKAFENHCATEDPERSEDLALLNEEWEGSRVDEHHSALFSFHARFAIKYGLPLTVKQSVDRIVRGKTISEGRLALENFEEKWGHVSPFYFTIASLHPGQSFPPHEEGLFNGDDAVEPTPEEMEALYKEDDDRRGKLAVIAGIISYKTAQLGQAAVRITQDVQLATADTFDSLFFDFGNVDAIWTALCTTMTKTHPAIPSSHA